MGRKINYFFIEDLEVEPFDSTETAWFWFCRMMMTDYKNRGDGDYKKTARPCEVNDIYLIVKSLLAKNILNAPEFNVLIKYGKQNQPPDVRFGATSYEETLWHKGIGVLDEVFKQRAIVFEWKNSAISN
ncbi:MAG: hypothetical protein AB7U85_02145 [Alphaproteobacteria bacterium]